MKKDFNAALQNSAFDGFSISQTEEERAAEKENTNTNDVAPAKAQKKDTEPEKPKKQRRISLYMEEGELLSNLDDYCQVHGVSKNKFIIQLIEDYLTDERMQKVRQSLDALK